MTERRLNRLNGSEQIFPFGSKYAKIHSNLFNLFNLRSLFDVARRSADQIRNWLEIGSLFMTRRMVSAKRVEMVSVFTLGQEPR